MGSGKFFTKWSPATRWAIFPECPSWVFEETAEADEFKALNKIILQAADPIAPNRHQCGMELLAALQSIVPWDDAGLAIASGQRDWGRYVYAGLAVVVMAAVWVYVQKIDEALAETGGSPPIRAVGK
jgi:hypothetical protein